MVRALGQARAGHPDTIIESYDIHLGTNHPTTPPIHTWFAGVREQLGVERAGLQGVTLVALAGELYRAVLLGTGGPPWCR